MSHNIDYTSIIHNIKIPTHILRKAKLYHTRQIRHLNKRLFQRIKGAFYLSTNMGAHRLWGVIPLGMTYACPQVMGDHRSRGEPWDLAHE